ncbi:MAG TPA: hypothetical protein VLM85_15780, partial [Polyangiaceae bacterium]|nr:hypothetical protein [Polyangiaceae bacterium]
QIFGKLAGSTSENEAMELRGALLKGAAEVVGSGHTDAAAGLMGLGVGACRGAVGCGPEGAGDGVGDAASAPPGAAFGRGRTGS